MPPPRTLLPCLLISTFSSDDPGVYHRYVTHIKSFFFTSHLPMANIRAIPLLARLLQRMVSLRYLRIDVCVDSTDLCLSVLNRFSLVRPYVPPPYQCFSLGSTASTPLFLPCIQMLRVNQVDIATQLLRLRPIEVVAIDRALLPPSFKRFIRDATSLSSSRLASLSLTLAGEADFVMEAARIVAHSFPSLEYMSLRAEPALTIELLVVCKIHTLLLVLPY